ncbi:cell wall-binding repeat-containing protein [Cryobacterium sp. MDB2-33-2]|nr:cell wall-binding repeat-containing protein [Cryobacterium sp. MDB2-33-2]
MDRQARSDSGLDQKWTRQSRVNVEYNFPDALSAVPVAAHFQAPVLLTAQDSLTPEWLAFVPRGFYRGASRVMIWSRLQGMTPHSDQGMNLLVRDRKVWSDESLIGGSSTGT